MFRKLLVSALFVCAFAPVAASAAVYGVYGTNDPAPGAGVGANCSVGAGVGEDSGCTSLRAAITASDADNFPDTINLHGTNYNKGTGGAGGAGNPDGATNPDFDIPATAGQITIRGIGGGPADNVINFKDGGFDPDRVFHVPAGASLRLENLTVTGGSWDFIIAQGFRRATAGDNSAGGNIRNLGTLALDGVAVSDGVNIAGSGGTGIYSGGTLSITDSTIAANDALNAPNPADPSNNAGGGALLLEGGTATISRSTFSANVGGRGAAILNNGANATITNSTITGNTAATVTGPTTYDGAGLVHDSGTTAVLSSTIAGNTAAATRAANISAGNGDTINIASSIVANPLGGGVNCTRTGGGAPGISGGYGLQHPLDSACVAALATGDVGGNPLLGSLASNGGATQTMALGSGSPAVDGGGSGCPATDQRGTARTDGNADGTVACDKGAFEAAAGTNPAPPTPPAGDTPGGGTGGILPFIEGGGGLPGITDGTSNTFLIGERTNLADGSVRMVVTVGGPGTLGAATPTSSSSASAAAKKKKKKAAPSIVPVSARAAKAGPVTLTLKLNSVGKRALKKKGSVPAKVKVTFTPTGGKPVSSTKTIVFKKKKK